MPKLIRLPGLIDCHVHLRDPGATHKEDFITGTKAALAGGFTTIIDMPNNSKPTTTLKRLEEKVKLAKKKAFCQVFFHFGADQNNFNQFPKVKNKVKSLKVYMDHTTGPLLVEDLAILEKHFQFWPKNLPILVHAEGASVLKAVQLSQIYRKRLHLCHVSLVSELEIVKWAKKRKLAVTCEVTPHHLFLKQNDEEKLGPFGMMRPPLRTKKDNLALWRALRTGLIDCLATDHAPHMIKEKKSRKPPNGVPGLETMLPLMLTAVFQKRLTLRRLVELVSENPARIFDIKRDRKTFTEVDLTQEWVIKNSGLKTKCGWSPFDGWKVQGRLKRVFIKGKKVFEDGKFL